jgi:hypothetical protein
VCETNGLRCEPAICQFMIDSLYARSGTPLLPCHPRDLIGMALDRAIYLGEGESLSTHVLRWAWDNYFVSAS